MQSKDYSYKDPDAAGKWPARGAYKTDRLTQSKQISQMQNGFPRCSVHA